MRSVQGVRVSAFRVALAVTAAIAIAGGCSSTDDSDPASADASSPSPTSSSPAATGAEPGAASVPSFPAGEPEELALRDIKQAAVDLAGGGGPDWMGSGFGSIWVRRDNAVIDRIAPDGAVEASIDAGIWQQPVCQGLSVTDVAVWGCATEGKLMRVDPKTNKVTAIVAIPKVNEQGRLTPYDGQIWILTGDGDQLVPVSEETNKPGPPIPLDGYCTDVADRVAGSTLWVVCPYENAVLAVDLDAREVTARVKGLPGATAVTAGGDVVWVCDKRGVHQIDPQSAQIAGLQALPVGVYCTLRLQGDTVWVRAGGNSSQFITGIDARRGGLAYAISAPGDTAGGDVIEANGALWASSYEEGVVYKLRLPGH